VARTRTSGARSPEMLVAINGGGEVGSFLARTLHAEGHAVSLIDARPEVMSRLAEELSTDVLLVEGEGCDVRALEEAGVDRADVFASVTPRDEDNLVACRLAQQAFGVRRVVARVNSPRNEATFHALGIEAISSTTVIGRLIEEQLSVGDIVRLSTLRKGNAGIVEVEVPDGPGSAAGRAVADLRLPEGIVLVAILRGDDLVIPRGPSVLRAGDRVMAVTVAGREGQLARMLRGNGAAVGHRDHTEASP
jgi:trk/ktr system potassium uptake protein